MKRSTFLTMLGFLGISKAQQWNIKGTTVIDESPGHNVSLADESYIVSQRPALNNQCPVCGTMAKPYSGKRAFTYPFCEGAQQLPPTKEMWEKCQDPPAQRIARCRHCNAAFWQNAS
jgi:hypothetical protein